MRVLFVSSSSDQRGSYTFRIVKLMKGLEAQGCETDILYLDRYPIASPSLLVPLNIPLFLRKLGGYDFIHAGSYVPAYVMAFAKRFIDIRIVHDVHGNGIGECYLGVKSSFDLRGKYILYQSRIIVPIANRQSDCFVVCSAPLRDYYVREGFPADRIELVRNGVDLDVFKPSDEYEPNDVFTLTYAGGFQEYQGVELLIEAVEATREEEVLLKLIGFKEKDQQLKTSIKERLGSRVQLFPHLDRGALVEHLQRSDCLVIPRGRFEDLPPKYRGTTYNTTTKFSEYIAVGKPVIVTSLEDSAEYVEKNDLGFVCEPDSVSMKNAILRALDTPEKDLRRMGKNGRRLAEAEFDEDVIGKRYRDFLSRVLNDA